MNKFAKGSLAAGAGIVLLLGGAGTLAYWNDSAELTGGTINAGTLDLQATGGSWYENGTKISNIAEFAMVPGDEVTYTVDLALLTQGDNMKGTIALNQDFVVDAGAQGQVDVDLEVAEGKTLPAGITLDPVNDDTLIFTGEHQSSIPVQVTVSFPYDTTKQQNTSMTTKVNLDKITFTATQGAADGAATITPAPAGNAGTTTE